MIREINHNQMLLNQRAKLATTDDKQVIADLRDTLAANSARCVGMAANMIGVNKRIIIAQMGPIAMIMVNPVITAKSSQFAATEGCLSLDGQRATKRFENIKVRYADADFKPHEQEFTGWVAQIIQHEVDHCDGILI